VFSGVGCGVIICGGFIRSLVVICSNFGSRFGIFIVVFLWCMHNIRTASGSMRGSLFSSGVWLVLYILWSRVGNE
jgi:hypothetical protein